MVYQVVHHMLLAHAKAYRLYEKVYKPTQKGTCLFWSQDEYCRVNNGYWYLGRVGIVQVIFWYEPKDNNEVHVAAAHRALSFIGGWPSDPIFGNGDYPQDVKDIVKN